jgi:hypothetical protein
MLHGMRLTLRPTLEADLGAVYAAYVDIRNRPLLPARREVRIQLDIVPENAASRRIAEKCGFTLEGTAGGGSTAARARIS